MATITGRVDQRKIEVFEDGAWVPVGWDDCFWTSAPGLILACRDPWHCFRSAIALLDGQVILEWCMAHPVAEVSEGVYIAPALGEAELHAFLDRFQPFFAQDGRGVLAVSAGESRVTLDEHNWVLWEGAHGAIADWIATANLVEREVELPFPHRHVFHEDLTPLVPEICDALPWSRFELTPS